MHKYHQIMAATVSKNKFSPNICIILNAFFGIRGFKKGLHDDSPSNRKLENKEQQKIEKS